MLFSYCVPIRNRAPDFKKALPTVLAAAGRSPPVEVVVLDYGSTDDLADYLMRLELPRVRWCRHEAPHFHMAHARNLAMLSGQGEFLISTNADTLLDESYFEVIREIVEKTDCDVVRAGKRINGVLVVRRDEFVKAGGFDERFEFYGPEDKDLVARLTRRGLRTEFYDPTLLSGIYTPNDVKVQGYRLPLSKREMAKRMHAVFEENEQKGALVANESGWVGS